MFTQNMLFNENNIDIYKIWLKRKYMGLIYTTYFHFNKKFTNIIDKHLVKEYNYFVFVIV